MIESRVEFFSKANPFAPQWNRCGRETSRGYFDLIGTIGRFLAEMGHLRSKTFSMEFGKKATQHAG
jgi:hypothetical protein